MNNSLLLAALVASVWLAATGKKEPEKTTPTSGTSHATLTHPTPPAPVASAPTVGMK